MSLDLASILAYFPFVQDWVISFWWLWVFLALFFLGRALWLAYVQDCYRTYPKVIFELRIPREIRKTPRAMEQVFTSLHALKNVAGNFEEKWIQGEVPEVFSCEVASFGGEVHFYMRVPKRHENMVKAALYGQYPDMEIEEVEDYVYRMPFTFKELSNTGYNIFGNELRLTKPERNVKGELVGGDVYPIRTYIDFEAVDEIKELDPIAPLLELLGNLKPQEQIWVQIVLQPLSNFKDVHGPDEIENWKKKGQDVIERIKGTSRSAIDPKTGDTVFTFPSPTDTEAMKAIDRTIGKPGFWTVIRYLYIAPKEMYTTNFGQRGVFSALNQYATEGYNKFGHNIWAWTRTSMWYSPYFFPRRRGRARRERIYWNYRTRKTYDDTLIARLFHIKFFHLGLGLYRTRFVMNTECLATIYHMPTYLSLTGPFIKRVEAKRGGPPAGLPIYGGEGEELPGVK